MGKSVHWHRGHHWWLEKIRSTADDSEIVKVKVRPATFANVAIQSTEEEETAASAFAFLHYYRNSFRLSNHANWLYVWADANANAAVLDVVFFLLIWVLVYALILCLLLLK